ncbi:MAG: oligosaccharide flippase family protein [Nitrososphaeria archaeon]|nr:oligosaccharide flippase family protein [Nitrososphaeria archaeon]
MSENLSNIIEESARGGFFLFIGYFMSLVILALGSMIVGRLLGPEGFGIFSLAFVVPTLILGFLDPGVGAALTRYTAKYRTEKKLDFAKSILRTGLLYKVTVSTIATISCIIFSDNFATILLNRPELGNIVKIASIIIFFQTIFNYLGEAFSGLDRMEGNALILNIEAVAKTFLSPILIVLGLGVIGAVIGHIASYAVAVVVGIIFFIKVYNMMGNPAENSFLDNIKMMISYGFPLYAANFLNTISSQFQILVLAYFASNSEIGNFYVAARLLALVGVLAYPFSALFPAFSKVKIGSKELQTLFKLSTKYTSLAIVPATVLVMALSKDVVYAFYGRSYTLAPEYLTLYVLTNLYAGFGAIIFGHMFNGLGYTRVSFYSTLVNFITFIPLVYILTSKYSVLGTLYAIIISQTLSLAYNIWASKKVLNLKFETISSAKIYLISFIAVIPLILFSNILYFPYWIINLIVRGTTYFIIYLTLLPLSKTITEYDLENIETLVKRHRLFKTIMGPIIKYERILAKIY